MKLFSPQLTLLRQIPIVRPNSEVFLSPSYISCASAAQSESYTLVLTGRKLLYSLEIEFDTRVCSTDPSPSGDPSEPFPRIQWRLTNFQKKGKKCASFSAGLALDQNSVLVGGFDGTLLILDMREKYLVKLNKIHLDAVHHLQKVDGSPGHEAQSKARI